MAHDRRADADVAAKVALIVMGPLLGVSKACRLLNVSRDTYYRHARRYQLEGLRGLLDGKDDERHKTRVSVEVETAIMALAEREPHLGKEKVSARIRGLGFRVSPSGVASVWKRKHIGSRAERVELARKAGPVGEEGRAIWEAVLGEQRELRITLARLTQQLERERPAKATPAATPSLGRTPGIIARMFGKPAVAEPFDVQAAIGRSPAQDRVGSIMAAFRTPAAPRDERHHHDDDVPAETFTAPGDADEPPHQLSAADDNAERDDTPRTCAEREANP